MFKILEKSLAQGAEYADLYYLERNEDTISFEGGELKTIKAKNVSGFSLQVKKDGRVGIVSSSNLNNNDDVLKMALAASSEGEAKEYDFNRPQTLNTMSLTHDALWERSLEEYVADGEEFVQMLKDYDPEVTVSIEFKRSRQTRGYLNTYGCDYISPSDQLSLGYSGLLVEGANILEVGDGDMLRGNTYDIAKHANLLINKLKIGRVEQSLEAGRMPVLLTPNAVAQFMYAFVSGLSGEFVRLGISPLKNRLGEQVLSEEITLIDDMTLPENFEACPFDDEGTPAERTLLYEKGVLRNYLLTLKAAHALNLKPNGKALRRGMFRPRDYANMPVPWYSTMLLEPGQIAYEDMLKDIKEGIVVDSAIGLVMGDLVRGDIDSDIDLGFKIENGKITGRVKDAAFGINIYEVFKNQIAAVENKVHATSNDGQSNMYFPHILLKDINIVR